MSTLIQKIEIYKIETICDKCGENEISYEIDFPSKVINSWQINNCNTYCKNCTLKNQSEEKNIKD